MASGVFVGPTSVIDFAGAGEVSSNGGAGVAAAGNAFAFSSPHVPTGC